MLTHCIKSAIVNKSARKRVVFDRRAPMSLRDWTKERLPLSAGIQPQWHPHPLRLMWEQVFIGGRAFDSDHSKEEALPFFRTFGGSRDSVSWASCRCLAVHVCRTRRAGGAKPQFAGHTPQAVLHT